MVRFLQRLKIYLTSIFGLANKQDDDFYTVTDDIGKVSFGVICLNY